MTSRPPIFILSCPRSGSTMLRYILDAHPQICCPPEVYLGALCQQAFKTIRFTLAQAKDSEIERDEYSFHEVRRIISDVMGQYCQINSKVFWCEKTPDNLNHLSYISRVFPDAKYICLYRHCVDVVNSMLQVKPYVPREDILGFLYKNHGNVAGAEFDRWIEQTGYIYDFEHRNKSSCFNIKYEELVCNTESTLRALFEFLGVESSNYYLNLAFNKHHDQGEGDSNVRFEKTIHANSIGKGFLIPLEFIDSDVKNKANALLSTLEYSPIESFCADGLEKEISRINNFNRKDKPQSMVKEKFFNIFGMEGINISNNLNGKCRFVVTDTGELWVVEALCSKAIVLDVNSHSENTVLLDSGTLMGILNGNVNPIMAYRENKIKIFGDIDIVMSIADLLLNTKQFI